MSKRKLRDDPFVKLIKKFGYLKVQRSMNFVVAWAWAMRATDNPNLTMADYIRYWQANHSSAYREQQSFREVTGLVSPVPIIEAMREAGFSFDEKPAAADGFAVLPFLVA